jgi:hypothetical protein
VRYARYHAGFEPHLTYQSFSSSGGDFLQTLLWESTVALRWK